MKAEIVNLNGMRVEELPEKIRKMVRHVIFRSVCSVAKRCEYVQETGLEWACEDVEYLINVGRLKLVNIPSKGVLLLKRGMLEAFEDLGEKEKGFNEVLKEMFDGEDDEETEAEDL